MLTKVRVKRLIRPYVRQSVLTYLRPWLELSPVGRRLLTYTWAGIYPHLNDVNPAGVMDPDSAWQQFHDSSVDDRQDVDDSDWYTFLPMLVSIVGHETKSETVRVLDYGGGIGTEYSNLLKMTSQGVDYHIVELEYACRRGNALFRHDKRVHFHKSLPAGLPVDIVHLNSSLQYVEEYAGLLKALCGYGARYVSILRTNFSECPSFATAELNISQESVIPCWFFNLDEIISLLKEEGYSLTFKRTLADHSHQANLPEAHRGQPLALLFCRR